MGSLLAYCLGITEVNPLEHGLFFERFLNVERENLPDIDLDLGHRRRNEAVQYLKRTHGPDRVVHQGVITRLGARGAVRAAGRGLGTDPAIVDRVSKLLPLTRGKGGLADSLRSLPESRGLPLQDQRIGSLIKAATLLEGLPTGYATHGSALIISPRPVLEDLPLTLGAGGQFITQYGPEAVSAFGFPKFDLLGLRNLTLIQDTLVAAGGEGTPAGTEGTPARPCETLDEKIPADDAKTWEIIGRGETIGCFQLDSPGMREVLRVTRPGSLGELSAALSLYRPGPWDPETLGAYVRRKEGKNRFLIFILWLIRRSGGPTGFSYTRSRCWNWPGRWPAFPSARRIGSVGSWPPEESRDGGKCSLKEPVLVAWESRLPKESSVSSAVFRGTVSTRPT